MYQEEHFYRGQVFVRVNKHKARAMFKQGETVLMLQSNMRIDNMWQAPYPISRFMDCVTMGHTFDSIVDEFMYYNCDAERGYSVKYYVKKRVLKSI